MQARDRITCLELGIVLSKVQYDCKLYELHGVDVAVSSLLARKIIQFEIKTTEIDYGLVFEIFWPEINPLYGNFERT